MDKGNLETSWDTIALGNRRVIGLSLWTPFPSNSAHFGLFYWFLISFINFGEVLCISISFTISEQLLFILSEDTLEELNLESWVSNQIEQYFEQGFHLNFINLCLYKATSVDSLLICYLKEINCKGKTKYANLLSKGMLYSL